VAGEGVLSPEAAIIETGEARGVGRRRPQGASHAHTKHPWWAWFPILGAWGCFGGCCSGCHVDPNPGLPSPKITALTPTVPGGFPSSGRGS